MATNILGLFTSPEQYQANQMAQFRQQAANEVQLDPFQQASIGMRQAGYQLGGGIGGALGGQDPQLQKIARRQALAGQLDQSNPQSYMQVAKLAAENGDPEFATIIADAGREAAIKVAQANKERQMSVAPDIQKAQQAVSISQALDMYKAMPETPEIKKAIKTLELQLGFLTPKEKPEPRITVGSDREGVSLELYNKPYIDLTQIERAAVNKRVETEAASKVPKISVDLKDPTAVAKASLDVMGKWEGFLGKGGDVEVANRYKAVQSAVLMANAGNPTADGALLYNIAKMYDPSGAVQEGDKKSITGNPAIPERFKLLVQGVLNGGSFTPTQRKDLEKIANEIVKNRESQLNVYRKQYVNKVKDLGGTESDILNPYQNLVRPPLSTFTQTPNTNPQNITGGRR
jgi:hypothetical protein